MAINKQTDTKKKSKYNNFKPKYTANEKRAYYTGFGVGLTESQCYSSKNNTHALCCLMSSDETMSYIRGFFNARNNASIKNGTRKKGRWL